MQDAFLSLWRNSAQFDTGRGSVRTWVLTVVHNRSIDALRRARVRDSRDAQDPEIAERIAGPDRTETEVIRRDEAGRVRAAIDRLPAEQRHVIELAYFDGLTHREIAELLELPPGTVKGRIRLGLQKLRELLEPEREAAPQWPAPLTWCRPCGQAHRDDGRPAGTALDLSLAAEHPHALVHANEPEMTVAGGSQQRRLRLEPAAVIDHLRRYPDIYKN